MTNITRNRADRPVLRGRAGLTLLGAAALWLVLGPAPGRAFDLFLPGNARETARLDANPDSHALAIGPVTDGALETLEIEGRISRAAFRVAAQGVTTLQLLAPLRDQLLEAGFDILFECKDFTCGGFDFRYRLTVLPEPDMHVDLFDYRYLAAVRLAEGQEADAAGEYVALLVSRSANAGYLDITQITPSGTDAPVLAPGAAPAARPGTAQPLIARLEERGHAVLLDLTFETGSSALGAGSFGSLDVLAAYLLADASRRIALVGHTDATGALDTNIALSKRRATSVLERLATAHGVPRNQLEAEGTGYLAPRTTNRTQKGREMNRRVEAVLLNTN